MSDDTYYQDQRLSLKGQACTVRYIGEVAGKQGTWLGVEWDDDERGKHNGMHNGRQYFTCRSQSVTAASFLRPNQKWDERRTFLQALSEKYFQLDQAESDEVIYVSRNKVMEEVGFEKFAKRQAELMGIHTVVLDHMCIYHDAQADIDEKIREICEEVTDLDLSSNLFETYQDILDLCSLLPKLRRLSLAGNRFSLPGSLYTINTHSSLRSIDLSKTKFTDYELSRCLLAAPQLEELTATDNDLRRWSDVKLPAKLHAIDLSSNSFTSLSQLEHILALPTVTKLTLKQNSVREIWQQDFKQVALSSILQELDLRHNSISSWLVLDHIRTSLPTLKHLLINGNPLLDNILSADGKALTREDGLMLAVARLPDLESLNYSTISDKERLNAERFYLSQIGIQLSRADAKDEPNILLQHPRFSDLCEEYGMPQIERAPAVGEIDPRSLAARLVAIDFVMAESIMPTHAVREWTVRLPKALNVYALYGVVAKELAIVPLHLKLVWLTEEVDPIAMTRSDELDWWDSSDEEASQTSKGTAWVKRAVELVPGTRTLGTYFDGRQATVQIDHRSV